MAFHERASQCFESKFSPLLQNAQNVNIYAAGKF